MTGASMPGAKTTTGAAKAVDAPVIEVTSLKGALECLLEVPEGRRDVRVRALEVHHAAGLAEMLSFHTSRRRWKIRDFRKLKVLASADALLLIVEGALLPILSEDPTSLPALNLLERYANRLHTLSISVGGTFEEEVDILGQDLTRYVNEGRANPLSVSVEELVARITTLRACITTLRDQVVGLGDNTISDGESEDKDDGF